MKNKDREVGRKLRLSFYQSSEGPCVTLFGPLDVDLEPLRECFWTLSKDGTPVQLDEAEFIVPFGDLTVLARSSGAASMSVSRTRPGFLRSGDAGLNFVWTQAPEDWAVTAELVEGLIAAPSAGHQYLPDYPADDAIVVVSKGEFSEGVLGEGRP